VSTLDIETETREHTVTVRLGGEFDLSGIRDFRRALLNVRAPDVTMVYVDLRGLSFMGASGLRALLELHNRSSRDGFELFVIKGGPLIQRVFEMTGMDTRLTLLDAEPPR
jgi:anti-sigma B factor antagonist